MSLQEREPPIRIAFSMDSMEKKRDEKIRHFLPDFFVGSRCKVLCADFVWFCESDVVCRCLNAFLRDLFPGPVFGGLSPSRSSDSFRPLSSVFSALFSVSLLWNCRSRSAAEGRSIQKSVGHKLLPNLYPVDKGTFDSIRKFERTTQSTVIDIEVGMYLGG